MCAFLRSGAPLRGKYYHSSVVTSFNDQSIIVLFTLINCTLCAPISNLFTTPNVDPVLNFELHVLEQFSTSVMTSLANPPLFTDINMDGEPDLIFTTMDGTVRVYLSVGNHLESSTIQSIPSSWPFVVRGEHFASSPLLVHFDDKGNSLIVVVSVRGVIYALGVDGTPSVQLQIPDLILDLKEGDRLDLPDVSRNLRWHIPHQSGIRNPGIRLAPRVYSTGLSPTVAVQHPPTDPLDVDAIIIPVNFVPADSGDGADIILAALIGVSRRVFISAHLWDSRNSFGGGLSIHLLEVGKLRDSKPPYLFASLALSASPLSQNLLLHMIHNPRGDVSLPALSWHPTYKAVVPSFSGQLHIVTLPLGKIDHSSLARHQTLHSRSSSMSSFAQPPVLVSCTQSGSTTDATVCCLLVDTASRLLLLTLDSDRHSPVTRSGSHGPKLMWIYSPPAFTAQFQRDQVGQVTVVNCEGKTGITADSWAVYPTADGWLHAVSILNGSAIPDYPLRVIGADQSANVTFSMGPGLLYTSSDAEPWMLLSDTTGTLYQVPLCRRNPTVVQSSVQSANGFRPSNVWLMPAPLVNLVGTPETAHGPTQRQSITTFILSAEGVAFLKQKPSGTVKTAPSGDQHGSIATHYLLAPSQDLVYFVDSTTEHTVGHLRLEGDQRVLNYRIHNCPLLDSRQPNVSTPTVTVYLIQLVDALGMQLSDWFIASRRFIPSDESTRSSSVCGGSLTISRPMYGSFRGRLYLLVLDSRTGLIRAPLTTAQQTATILLDVETLWPQLLILWTYLPLLYLFAGLAILHVSSPKGDLAQFSSV